MKTKDFLKKGSALVLAFLLTGCQESKPDLQNTEQITQESEETVFRKCYSIECTNINYLTSNSFVDTNIPANIIDCLVDFDCYGNVLPGLAESWESNADKTVWTFHIRPDVWWLNYEGEKYTEVTADDWVTSAQYVNDARHESTCQYMYTSGSIVKGAEDYYNYTDYLMKTANGTVDTDPDGNKIEPVAEVNPESIGVKAIDKYTLEYTLEQPCPFFLSVLSYTSYMPVNRQFLEECGDMFGRNNKNLLYNGAYILSYYQPQEKHILSKNPQYWDLDNVHIDRIEEEYNPDAFAVQSSMFLNGQIDYAQIDSDMLDTWLNDETTKNLVHRARPDISYSYFYTFNFDPKFNAEYEPENWLIAVNNENFRQAIASAINKKEVFSVYEPYGTESIISNTVTPKTFTAFGGMDYTEYPALKDITNSERFNEEQARIYRDKAREEIEELGGTFPVKILMPYNPGAVNWNNECYALEKQLEDTLGSDFIDVIVQAGPESGFLSAVRRSGNYAFMKCNWGADYTDPQTYTEPFAEGSTYNFWYKSENPDTQQLYQLWTEKVNEAKSNFTDYHKRYTLFSEAESLLINHAVIVPASISLDSGYCVSKLNPFEGEFSSIGIVLQRYKLYHMNETSMSMEEYSKEYQKWLAERDKASQNSNQ